MNSTDVFLEYAPVTRGFDLVAASAASTAKEVRQFATDMRRPMKSPDLSEYRMHVLPIHSLAEAFKAMFPATENMTTRYLVLTTRLANWSTVFTNHLFARGDPGLAKLLSQRLKTKTVGGFHVESPPSRHAGPRRPFDTPGASFYVHLDGQLVRSIDCVQEGSGWRFAQSGEPLPFEMRARYNAKSKRQRFTGEMLRQYLAEMELYPFDPAFYRVSSAQPAKIVEFVTNDPQMQSWLIHRELEDIPRP